MLSRGYELWEVWEFKPLLVGTVSTLSTRQTKKRTEGEILCLKAPRSPAYPKSCTSLKITAVTWWHYIFRKISREFGKQLWPLSTSGLSVIFFQSLYAMARKTVLLRHIICQNMMFYIMCQVPVGLCTVAYLILIAEQNYITCCTCCSHREQLPLEHTLISVAIFFCIYSEIFLSFFSASSVFLFFCLSKSLQISPKYCQQV